MEMQTGMISVLRCGTLDRSARSRERGQDFSVPRRLRTHSRLGRMRDFYKLMATFRGPGETKDQILRRSSTGSCGKSVKLFGWELSMVVTSFF